jgi:hypothetical protein
MKILLSVSIVLLTCSGCTMQGLFGKLYVDDFDEVDNRAVCPSMVLAMDKALPMIREQAKKKDEGTHYAMLIGDYEQSKGNPKAAEDAYALAVAHSPDSVRARLALGDSRLAQNHRMKAVMTYADALRTRPDDAKALVAMAAVLEPDRPLQAADIRVASIPARSLAPVDTGRAMDVRYEK